MCYTNFKAHFLYHAIRIVFNFVIADLYHSFETLLLLSLLFFLMVKSSKSFVKIGSRFQISPFIILSKFRPLPLRPYLILPKVPTSTSLPRRLLEPPVYSGPKNKQLLRNVTKKR